MANFASTAELTNDQRLDEIARILASGILLLRIKRVEKTGKTENFFLDKGSRTSPYVPVKNDGPQRRKP